jgi:gliding motility-associated lipoprotein GldH
MMKIVLPSNKINQPMISVLKKWLPCIFILLSACSGNRATDYYHRFENNTWQRFDILKFDIPIEKTNTSYDIYFFAHHTRDYEYDNLDFNMDMSTPSGEERIREYHFPIKRSGNFTGTCTDDSCEAIIPLKKEMNFSAKGHLIIEIENLVPRLETRYLLGVGIRLVPHGK